MKAIVHIGSPKTGSSSIQAFLFHNAAEIARRGIRYDRNFSRGGSQYEFPLAVLTHHGRLLSSKTGRVRYGAGTLEEAKKRYDDSLEVLKSYPKRFNEPVALFSSEHITPWINTEEIVKEFDAAFSNTFEEVRYVLYLRRQTDLLVSSYSERIKRGSDKPFEVFFEKRIKSMNHYRTAKRWANAVGKDRLDVRLMEPDFLHTGDLIEDFCHVCGFSTEGLKPPVRRNEAITATCIEVMRHLNLRVPELLPKRTATGKIRNPLRFELLEHVAAITADDPKFKLLPYQHDRLEQAVSESNEKLRREFFPQREVLFKEKKGMTPVMSQAEIKDKALDVLTEILIRIRQGQIKPLSRLMLEQSITTNDDAFSQFPSGRMKTNARDPVTLERAARFAGRKFRKLTKLRSSR